jgi:septum formation protein
VTSDPPDVDERALDELFAKDPVALAVRLARLKAEAVIARHPACTIVAGDQVGVLELRSGPVQLTKRPDTESAVAQLMRMAGTTHRLVNGIVVVRTGSDGAIVASASGTDVQEVTMRRFSRAEAVGYVERFRPFDSAGSYRLEDQELMGESERFVTEVRGEDPATGVLGMPIPLLVRLLQEVALDR